MTTVCTGPRSALSASGGDAQGPTGASGRRDPVWAGRGQGAIYADRGARACFNESPSRFYPRQAAQGLFVEEPAVCVKGIISGTVFPVNIHGGGV